MIPNSWKLKRYVYKIYISFNFSLDFALWGNVAVSFEIMSKWQHFLIHPRKRGACVALLGYVATYLQSKLHYLRMSIPLCIW